MKKVFYFFILIFIYLTIPSPVRAQSVAGNNTPNTNTQLSKSIDAMIEFGKTFIGKPYKYQGPSSWPMDCSGYLAYIFSEHGFSLPRSSASMATSTQKISMGEIQKGDLLFFTGRDKNSGKVGHVSMVIEVNQDHIKMMHSCSRGVIIDEYPKMTYYKERFIMVGRPTCFANQPNTQIEFTELVLDTKKQEKNNLPDTLQIIGVGDMMLGTNYPSSSYLPPNDGKDILAPVKHILENADLTFGNMEGVILTGEGKVKSCSDPKVCYAFKSPDHYINYFAEAGFDVLSIANNHVGDFGDIGRKNTVEQLNKTDIKYAGLLAYPFTTFEKQGIKYGFCAFAPNNGTISINDKENAIKIVQHLDSISDIVIVSFHGGAEGPGHRNITRKEEIFLGENRGSPYEFSRVVIDAGADIVFGHGPHVTRAIDLYKNRFIAYSLGNFCTYGRFNLKGSTGIAPIVKVAVNRKGEFISAQIFSIQQLGEGGPTPDEENGALKEIIELTQTDLPECGLLIGMDGKVTKK
jgi:poly-gamma-glutamate capsule biosynthesis protein CapA/YwtB (metallophosphatase superfamily)